VGGRNRILILNKEGCIKGGKGRHLREREKTPELPSGTPASHTPSFTIRDKETK
jgi:hypothetical protein